MTAFAETAIEIPVTDHQHVRGAIHAGSKPLRALVLHPHPQYGGDMDNHVVTALCRALAGEGATTLRFDFRRGGMQPPQALLASAATDARAAAGVLAVRAPADAPLLLAGYSFGAAIAAAVALDLGAAALALVSLPAQAARGLPDGIPALIVTGALDQIAPPEPLLALDAPGRSVVAVEGVDHFWATGLAEVAEHLAPFVRNLLSEQ